MQRAIILIFLLIMLFFGITRDIPQAIESDLTYISTLWGAK